MELKLFTDLIDALGKVAGGLKAIVNLAKAEREAMRRTLDETYHLVDTTLDIVMIRLGDILLHPAHDDFLREAGRLDHYNEWMQPSASPCRLRAQGVLHAGARLVLGRALGIWVLELLLGLALVAPTPRWL